jgi:hypothetical protein
MLERIISTIDIYIQKTAFRALFVFVNVSGAQESIPPAYTDKKKSKFSSYIRKLRGIGCKVINY